MCLKSFLSIIKMLFIYFCTLDEKHLKIISKRGCYILHSLTQRIVNA